MDSVSPFSNLNGFFLRLRLGKWEEGLGGTGYYVACISGIVRIVLSCLWICLYLLRKYDIYIEPESYKFEFSRKLLL